MKCLRGSYLEVRLSNITAAMLILLLAYMRIKWFSESRACCCRRRNDWMNGADVTLMRTVCTSGWVGEWKGEEWLVEVWTCSRRAAVPTQTRTGVALRCIVTPVCFCVVLLFCSHKAALNPSDLKLVSTVSLNLSFYVLPSSSSARSGSVYR